jgi:hypothetical protein
MREKTHVRSKRNIFGSIISSLTGLATGMCLPHRHIDINTILGSVTEINVNEDVRVLIR